MCEEYTAKCIICGNEQHGIIQAYENEEDVEVVLRNSDICISKKADNYFEALIGIRRELEKKGIKLLCKGCCRNVYPSAMILEMGSGEKAYSLTMGKQARMDSLVNIFEECKIEEYASIDEQYKFFQKWLTSIGGK